MRISWNIIFVSLTNAFQLQTTSYHMTMTNANNKANHLIKTLKTNNENIFKKSPNLSMFDDKFVLSVNGTAILPRTRYKSLFRKLQKCKNYISDDTTISNNFYYNENKKQNIVSYTECKFKLKFSSRHMRLQINSNYLLNSNFKVIEHELVSLSLNDTEMNVLDLIKTYFEKNSHNKSFINFLVFIFTKNYRKIKNKN